MNSRDLKKYKYVKISKSNFLIVRILSLYTACSENKNVRLNKIYSSSHFQPQHITYPHSFMRLRTRKIKIIIGIFFSQKIYYCTCVGLMLISLYLVDYKCVKIHPRNIPPFTIMYWNSFVCLCALNISLLFLHSRSRLRFDLQTLDIFRFAG